VLSRIDRVFFGLKNKSYKRVYGSLVSSYLYNGDFSTFMASLLQWCG
jgi:hypothetical protein